ncbi:MAG: DMT family transporter [Nitratireductor sp.]|nr:DMT family transporter [Nitratireductor sp.]MCB1456771.1 DMT family transporter [Nitratireductor sp.]
MIDNQTAQHSPLYGIALKVVSVAVFVVMSTCIKATAPHIPPGEAVFFRSFFALPAITIWLVWRGQLRTSVKTDNHLGHFWRGLVGVTAMFLGFTALGLIPLPEAVTIGYAAPLIATILAAMFLGERIRFYRMGAVFAGMLGVILVLSPRLTLLHEGDAGAIQAVGALCALMGAVFAAMAQIFVRKLVTAERTATIVIYFSLTSTSLSLLTLPFGWVIPEMREAGLLVMAGILGGVGQIFLTESYRHAETAVIASFEYTSMLMALAIGYFVFSEVPTAPMLGGAALIMLAGLVILLRERQLGIERARSRKVMTPQG